MLVVGLIGVQYFHIAADLDYHIKGLLLYETLRRYLDPHLKSFHVMHSAYKFHQEPSVVYCHEPIISYQ